MILRFLSALLLIVGLALPLAAQEDPVPAEWDVVSNRAVALLQSERVADERLEGLRQELVSWRTRFDEARKANSGRIATVRAEIDALGEPPAEGETEPSDVAALREELGARLEALLVPVRSAEAAYNAANGLIGETDTLIESRRAEALFSQEAAPLNPVYWWAAVAAAGAWFGALASQVSTPFLTGQALTVLQAQSLPIGLQTAVAILLLLRGPRWVEGLRPRLLPAEERSPLARLGLLGLTFAKMALPVVGLMIAANLLLAVGVEGAQAEALITAVPFLGGMVLLARWLAKQAFPPRPESMSLIPVAQANRSEGRFHALVLGLMAMSGATVEIMAQTDPAMADYRGVFHFVLALITGLTLVRLGQLLLREGRTAAEEGEGGFWAQVMRLVGRALMLVGLVAPLVTGAGYVNLGLAMIWPMVLSLALVAMIGVAQSVVFDTYAAVTGRTETARDALAPTLVGFGLAVAALPLFALIWGVRWQTLAEWWEAFLNGFAIGETTLSPVNFLTFAVVFVVGYMATRLVKGFLRTSVLPKTRLDTGGTNAILSGTGYLGITLAALLAITMAGIDLSGLAIVAGALSVGVGFGLQTIVQNFVSGIILLIERPIKIGDWINVNGMDGFVRQISVRSTRIETFDRQDVIIPNADLISGTVTNYTLGNSSGRVLVPVGVAYGTDTRKVETILREITEAHPMVVLNPPPVITFEGFGADSMDFLIRAVLRDVLWKVSVKSELNHEIARRFQEEGIEIPFAQRDVWLRNPEALRTAPGSGAASLSEPEIPADDAMRDDDDEPEDTQTSDPAHPTDQESP